MYTLSVALYSSLLIIMVEIQQNETKKQTQKEQQFNITHSLTPNACTNACESNKTYLTIVYDSLPAGLTTTRMWANAKRDGRPVEYRWRPLFTAAVWVTPTTRVPCSNAAKTRNPLKFAGVPQTSEPILAVSSPHYEDVWRRYCFFTTFFLIVGIRLSCDDTARQSCAMVPRRRFFWRFFAFCIFSEPPAVHFRAAF